MPLNTDVHDCSNTVCTCRAANSLLLCQRVCLLQLANGLPVVSRSCIRLDKRCKATAVNMQVTGYTHDTGWGQRLGSGRTTAQLYTQCRHVIEGRLMGYGTNLRQVLKKGQEQVGLLPFTSLYQVQSLCRWYRHMLGTDITDHQIERRDSVVPTFCKDSTASSYFFRPR